MAGGGAGPQDQASQSSRARDLLHPARARQDDRRRRQPRGRARRRRLPAALRGSHPREPLAVRGSPFPEHLVGGSGGPRRPRGAGGERPPAAAAAHAGGGGVHRRRPWTCRRGPRRAHPRRRDPRALRRPARSGGAHAPRPGTGAGHAGAAGSHRERRCRGCQGPVRAPPRGGRGRAALAASPPLHRPGRIRGGGQASLRAHRDEPQAARAGGRRARGQPASASPWPDTRRRSGITTSTPR